jgi:hypothetical protein
MGKLRQFLNQLRQATAGDVLDALTVAVGRSMRTCIERSLPRDIALSGMSLDEMLQLPTVVMYRRTPVDVVTGFVGAVEPDGTAAVTWIEEPTGQVWLTAGVPLHISGPVAVNECVLLSRGDDDLAL